ncbi:MAG: extracellular solute-binding protein [Pleomorphochaeta sp.]|jgi:multiple sugar transport system substrate-binding protein
MKKTLITMFAILLIAPMFVFAQGEKEDDNITIEFWTHEDANRQALEDRYIAEFEETHPNVTVNVTRQSSTKMIELVQTAFAAGEGPTIFNLSINDEYPFMAAQLVDPVDYKAAGYDSESALVDAYVAGMLDPVTIDGDVYGLPLELTNWSLFINKNVFKDAGLDPEKDYPKTWEEMLDVSEKLAIRDGDILIRRGFDFRYPYYLESMVPMVEQLGGSLFNEDGSEAIIGEDAWVAWLTYMQNWGPNGQNLGSPTYKNARKLFNTNNNDIAMAMTGLYQEARINHDNPDFYNSGEWMVVPFPTFENAVKDVAASYYGHYYMVNANENDATKEAAWELIGYMLSHGEEYLTNVNIIQPTKALMNSDTYHNMPYSDVFTKDFERGHVVYFGANSTEIQNLLRNAVESVMLQNVDPVQAYRQLKSSVQELIDEE